MDMLYFASDYMEGAHPSILQKLQEQNFCHFPGYGTDPVTQSAASRIRNACHCPEAEIHFLEGGTQTNAVVIRALLRPYQGVLAAETGHVSTHEAGAIEFGGHKVLPLPQSQGKINASDLESFMDAFHADDNHDHMVMPGMVYLSQPTEYGTLYSLPELSAIRRVCDRNRLFLYIDGARLAYALSSPQNDVTLPDLARLCDVFYIGGTKCGALLGEAVVVPKAGTIPHFFTIIKQMGALCAKGFVIAAQFDALFSNDLYLHIGDSAVRLAGRIQTGLSDLGIRLLFPTPTNQVFACLPDSLTARLREHCVLAFMEKADDTHTVMRFCTSWATEEAEVDRLLSMLEALLRDERLRAH